jgi:hypothetical protein
MIDNIMTPYSQVGGTGTRRNYVLLISSRLKRRLLQDIHPKRRQTLTRLHGAAEHENNMNLKNGHFHSWRCHKLCVYVYM